MHTHTNSRKTGFSFGLFSLPLTSQETHLQLDRNWILMSRFYIRSSSESLYKYIHTLRISFTFTFGWGGRKTSTRRHKKHVHNGICRFLSNYWWNEIELEMWNTSSLSFSLPTTFLELWFFFQTFFFLFISSAFWNASNFTLFPLLMYFLLLPLQVKPDIPQMHFKIRMLLLLLQRRLPPLLYKALTSQRYRISLWKVFKSNESWTKTHLSQKKKKKKKQKIKNNRTLCVLCEIFFLVEEQLIARRFWWSAFFFFFFPNLKTMMWNKSTVLFFWLD